MSFEEIAADVSGCRAGAGAPRTRGAASRRKAARDIGAQILARLHKVLLNTQEAAAPA